MKIEYLGFIPLILLEVWIWLPPHKINSSILLGFGYVPDIPQIFKFALRILTIAFFIMAGIFWAISY